MGAAVCRQYWRGLSLLLVPVLLLSACQSARPAAPADGDRRSSSLIPVKVQLNFIKNVEHAGMTYALDQGYYREQGLDVELLAGGTAVDPIQVVAGGSAAIGVTSASQLINARSQGVPIRAFAAQFQKSPLALTCRQASGVTTLADVRGKRIGVKQAGRPLFELFMRLNGIGLDEVQTQPNSATDVTPLIDGRIDCLFTTFAVNEPVSVERAGVPVVLFLIHDHGLPDQSNAYFATEETLTQRADMLVRWLRATLRGWQWVLANPEAAAQFVVDKKFAEGLNLEQQTEQARQQVPLMQSGLTEQRGLLWLDAASWRQTADNVLAAGTASRLVAPEEMLDLSVLERAKP
jgi:NitT/TauT family transport system substrate-binding protein